MTEAELELQTREAFARRKEPGLEFDDSHDGIEWRQLDRLSVICPEMHYRIRPVPPEPPFVLTREWFGLHRVLLRCARDQSKTMYEVTARSDTHIETTDHEMTFADLKELGWQALRVGVDREWIDLSTGRAVEDGR